MTTILHDVLFDKDGVLVDSEPWLVQAEKEVCRRCQLNVPDSEWDGFKGKTNLAIFTHILERYGLHHRMHDIQHMIQMKRELYLELAKDHLELIPGSLEFVAWVKQHPNVPRVGLVTSCSESILRFECERYPQMRPLFDHVLTGNMVQNGKPHPEPYLQSMTDHPAIAVEDSENGVISAKAAGCRVLGITTSFPSERLLACGADAVIHAFDDEAHRAMNDLLSKS